MSRIARISLHRAGSQIQQYQTREKRNKSKRRNSPTHPRSVKACATAEFSKSQHRYCGLSFKGPGDAPITVVEFADSCPHCRPGRVGACFRAKCGCSKFAHQRSALQSGIGFFCAQAQDSRAYHDPHLTVNQPEQLAYGLQDPNLDPMPEPHPPSRRGRSHRVVGRLGDRHANHLRQWSAGAGVRELSVDLAMIRKSAQGDGFGSAARSSERRSMYRPWGWPDCVALRPLGLKVELIPNNRPSRSLGKRGSLIANVLYVRSDNSVHSALHEGGHFLCMDNARTTVHTDVLSDDRKRPLFVTRACWQMS